MNKKLLRCLLAFSITASYSICFTVQANSLDAVNNAQAKTINAAVKSQKKIDSLSDQKETIEQEYRQLAKLVDDLKVYNKKLEIQTENQLIRIADIEKSISNVQVIQRQVLPLTERMIDSLDEFVSLDVPFHKAERQKRIGFLKKNLVKPELTTAEKFRQVLEAYKIEGEYGRKIDSYTDSLEIDGIDKKVTMLQIGRTALMYQTPDKRHTGMWDKDKGAFVEVDAGTYADEVRKGIRMSNKQANQAVLELPVFAPEVK